MLNDLQNGFEDTPDSDIGGPVSIEQAAAASAVTAAKYDAKDRKATGREEKLFSEACSKCGGDGRYRAPSSLGHQICLKCNGKGVLLFKRPRAERDAAKIKAAAAKAKKLDRNLAAFEAQYPTLAQWWTGNDFEFAISLREAARKYGHLTPGQLASAVRVAEKFEAAKAERAIRDAQKIEEVKALPVLDISHITDAFARARAADIKRPKLRLFSGTQSFEFSRAPDTGANPGAVYVNSEEGAYLGKIQNNKFLRGRDCDAEGEKQVLAVCSDPENAAIAYGKKYGRCSVCKRELSDPVSIANGIGPICSANFFGG